MAIPFSKASQLNHQLDSTWSEASASYSLIRTDDAQCENLPGRPRIRLHSTERFKQLEQEFATPDLNTFAPWLWLVGTQSSSHIHPLHEHVVNGRAIVITENPELHLTWSDKCIFIKPIPRYMLSHAFWVTHLGPRASIATKDGRDKEASETLPPAVLGFMRTYYYLIQYESDLHMAKQHNLLPVDDNEVTIESFHKFIAGFGEVQDDEVSLRYSSYGTLRLSRLNLWAKLALRRFQFYSVNHQYSEYFARFYGPILFLFGILTVVLSAMQVSLQAINNAENTQKRWVPLQSASIWFSVATLLCICIIGFVISFLLIFMVGREIAFATRDLFRRRRWRKRLRLAFPSIGR